MHSARCAPSCTLTISSRPFITGRPLLTLPVVASIDRDDNKAIPLRRAAAGASPSRREGAQVAASRPPCRWSADAASIAAADGAGDARVGPVAAPVSAAGAGRARALMWRGDAAAAEGAAVAGGGGARRRPMGLPRRP